MGLGIAIYITSLSCHYLIKFVLYLVHAPIPRYGANQLLNLDAGSYMYNPARCPVLSQAFNFIEVLHGCAVAAYYPV